MLRDAGAEGSLAEAEQAVAAFDAQGRGAISWEELKAAVDVAATPVDSRVRPIYATYATQGSNPGLADPSLLLTRLSLAMDRLTLLFTSQGTQFPVLPQVRVL